MMEIDKDTPGWKNLVTCALLKLYTTLIRSIQGKETKFTMIGRQLMGGYDTEIHLKWRGIKWEIVFINRTYH
jgi:hypothetical protein